MPGFDASEAVEELTYNFSKFGGGQGVIPEPTRAQLRRFGRAMDALQIDTSDADGVVRAYAPLSEEEAERLDGEILEAIAELCSGSPSAEEMALLPARHFRNFNFWLMGMLVDPPLSTPATSG